jgi:hypothetical protein
MQVQIIKDVHAIGRVNHKRNKNEGFISGNITIFLLPFSVCHINQAY